MFLCPLEHMKGNLLFELFSLASHVSACLVESLSFMLEAFPISMEILDYLLFLRRDQ